MARRKRRQGKPAPSIERVHPHEAVVLFERLRALGHISDAHIAEARRSVAHEVDEITVRLSKLKELAHAPATSRKTPETAKEAPQVRRGSKRRRRAKAPLTAKRRRIQQLQGRYMALGHQIPRSEKDKFREMIETKGKDATVAAMESFVESHAKTAKK